MFQKVLVIDDSPACAELAEKVLAQQYPGAAVDVLYAQRGMDAFERLQVAQPELILLSDALPDLKAEAVCARLLSDPVTASIPVCLVNASGEADSMEDRFPNIRKVISRPVRRDAMEDMLARLVAAPAPASVGSQFQDPARVAFSGHTGFFQIQAALQMAHGDRLTGVLRFFVSRTPIELYVSKGRFVFASTRNFALYCRDSSAVLEEASLGQVMEAQLGQAVSGCPLFLYLGLKGLLPQEEVVPLIREHGQRVFASLWSVGRVAFEFERMEVLPEFAAKSPASGDDADNWVLVCLRHLRMDQLPLSLRIGPNGSPVYTRRGTEVIQRLRLTERELRFASGVNGAESLLSLAKRTGIDLAEAQAMVFRFTALGVMDYWSGMGLPGAALSATATRRRTLSV
jgi:CheY-like chemotaxis protein